MILFLAMVLGAAGLIGLACAWRPLRGTTLRAAWWWAVAAVIAVAGTEIAARQFEATDSAGAALCRFAAAALTLCPMMAVFGAKRPQERPWQFIVLSFWIIVSLPAAQAWLMQSGEPPRPHPLWSWFVAALVIIGSSNYLFTRYWQSGLLVAAGQCFLFANYFPFSFGAASNWTSLAGLGCLAAASLAPAIGRQRSPPREGIDRLWRDFRDQYGVVWGLRIAERINASARMHGWPLRLEWPGFRPADAIDSSRPRTPSNCRRNNAVNWINCCGRCCGDLSLRRGSTSDCASDSVR